MSTEREHAHNIPYLNEQRIIHLIIFPFYFFSLLFYHKYQLKRRQKLYVETERNYNMLRCKNKARHPVSAAAKAK